GDAAGGEERDQRDDGEQRQRRAQPVDPGVRVFRDDGVGGLGGHAGLVELGLQVLVGQERDPAGQFHLCLGREVLRDGGVLLDAGQERRGQRGGQHPARQRAAPRGAGGGPR